VSGKGLNSVDQANFYRFANRYTKFRDLKNDNFENLYNLASVEDTRGSDMAFGAQQMGQFNPNDPLSSFGFDPTKQMEGWVGARGAEKATNLQSKLGVLGAAYGHNNASSIADINAQLGAKQANHLAQLSNVKTQGTIGAIGAGIGGFGTGLQIKQAGKELDWWS
jgi:hypothetical protein